MITLTAFILVLGALGAGVWYAIEEEAAGH